MRRPTTLAVTGLSLLLGNCGDGDAPPTCEAAVPFMARLAATEGGGVVAASGEPGIIVAATYADVVHLGGATLPAPQTGESGLFLAAFDFGGGLRWLRAIGTARGVQSGIRLTGATMAGETFALSGYVTADGVQGDQDYGQSELTLQGGFRLEGVNDGHRGFVATFSAVDGSDAPAWEVEGEAAQSIVFDGDQLVVRSVADVRAYDLTGAPRWTHPGRYEDLAVGVAGGLFAARAQAVTALGPTGAVLWRADTQGAATGPAAITGLPDGRIAVVFAGGTSVRDDGLPKKSSTLLVLDDLGQPERRETVVWGAEPSALVALSSGALLSMGHIWTHAAFGDFERALAPLFTQTEFLAGLTSDGALRSLRTLRGGGATKIDHANLSRDACGGALVFGTWARGPLYLEDLGLGSPAQAHAFIARLQEDLPIRPSGALPSVLDFSATNTSTAPGARIELSYQVQDAEIVRVRSDHGLDEAQVSRRASGQLETIALDRTSTFTLTAINARGSVTSTVVVEVNP